jgi:hydroxyacylglutathione hydrolase
MTSNLKFMERRAMIVKMLVVGPFASNCYIVGSSSTKQGIIIDPGAEAGNILRTVQEMGLSISLIVATHAHMDHIDALRAVKESTNAQFAIHEADRELLSTAPPMSVVAAFGLSPFKSAPQPDMLLRNGDQIDVGDLHFEVLHTPGHSPGGICLSGHGVVMKSIHEKLMVLPDETIVYPGHGPSTTIGDERRGNPFLQ